MSHCLTSFTSSFWYSDQASNHHDRHEHTKDILLLAVEIIWVEVKRPVPIAAIAVIRQPGDQRHRLLWCFVST